MLDQTEVSDNVSDLEVTTAAAYEDPTVADALAEMYRNEAEIEDADLERMHAAALADGVEHGPLFHDLTPARHAELMEMFPQCGWMPIVGYDARAEYPFTAELRRGTPNGPDIIRLANYSTAELALRACVMYAVNMVLVEKGYGDDQTRESMRSMIAYAERQRA